MTISETQRTILNQAALHPDGLAVSPAHLPPAPRSAIAKALLTAGLMARADGLGSDPDWKLDGDLVSLRITDAGRLAVGAYAKGAGTEGATTPISSPQDTTGSGPTKRLRLRGAATALLARWDEASDPNTLAAAIADLRVALRPTRLRAGLVRGPRQGTKQQAVLALLRRPKGATIAQVMDATGWAQHTVRGFFAHLKKKGHMVEVLDRVRQVGAGSAGAKGSYSIYRVAEAA